jgi:hypothetical protein
MRPESIRWFERVYWLHIAVAAIWLTWSYIQVSHTALSPGLEHLHRTRALIQGITSIVSIGIELLLWFFIARRGSNVAKWIFVAFFVLALLGTALLAFRYGQDMLSPVRLGVSILMMALRMAALWLLFRPDASAWFRGRHSPEELFDTFS